MKNRTPHIALFVFIAAVYILTAIRSHGYYHADEHYQIIEFAGLKLGTHNPEDLAWEFHQQLRPALQPALCFLIIKAASTLGLSDPYAQATALRLITAIFSLGILYAFAKVVARFFGIPLNELFLAATFLLWFIPFIHVRFSSETWSALCFILALTLLLHHEERQKKGLLLLSGLMLGLSFLFRYQAAILIAFLVLWLIAVKRMKNIALVWLTVPAFLVFLAGIWIDTWFYESFSITAWNYFRVNILENATAGFGVSPWYQYFPEIIQHTGYPFGILILLSLTLLLIRDPLNLFVWLTVPFILIHSMIGHKEIRFLFPLAAFIPPMIFTAWRPLVTNLKRYLHPVIRSTLITLLLILNSAGLAVMMWKPAGNGKMAVTRYIHRNYEATDKLLIHTSWSNPYNPWHSIPSKFYMEENLTFQRIMSWRELDTLYIPTDKTVLLTCRKYDLRNREGNAIPEKWGFRQVRRSIPPLAERLMLIQGASTPDEILLLYEWIP